ncbi:MAG TPA: ABC transporter substrate-binding protein, partial [Candidatus Binatia bacterium]|nr:ABC transporter substrate-binding protein [Candidatus Binatia bacterium]
GRSGSGAFRSWLLTHFPSDGREGKREGVTNLRGALYEKMDILSPSSDGLAFSRFLHAQYTKPVYISLPGPGNIQHLAYAVGKEKKFYDEMGIPNTQIVVLRGNAINVQALVSGTVHFSSAFGPAMQTMFRGEQLRILVQIFNQVPFGLMTRPEIKRLEDLKGMKIAVTFGGSTYSLLQALFAKHGLPANFADYINIPDNAGKVLALQQGRVVAAFMAPPTDQPLLKAGFKRLVYGGDEGRSPLRSMI